MTCPCIVVATTDSIAFDKCEVHYLTENKRYIGKFANITGHEFVRPSNQIERFIAIADWAYTQVKDCDAILLEDYSMGSKGKVFHIAENTAMLKYRLHVAQKKWSALPPTSLKKFAQGKGNADKLKMYAAFQTHTKTDLKKLFNYGGKSIGNPISDIVDAYYLCKYLFTNPLE